MEILVQCFLEESRNLMRLPPRLSTAEADLKVPFQQVIHFFDTALPPDNISIFERRFLLL